MMGEGEDLSVDVAGLVVQVFQAGDGGKVGIWLEIVAGLNVFVVSERMGEVIPVEEEGLSTLELLNSRRISIILDGILWCWVRSSFLHLSSFQRGNEIGRRLAGKEI
jgi:hypothetical protein